VLADNFSRLEQYWAALRAHYLAAAADRELAHHHRDLAELERRQAWPIATNGRSKRLNTNRRPDAHTAGHQRSGDDHGCGRVPDGPGGAWRHPARLIGKITMFISTYNRTATPFRWTYDAKLLRAA